MKAPFLRKMSFTKGEERNDYPFSIPVFKDSFEIDFFKPLTIIVGENGAGKSTLLEVLANHCGFSAQGGSQNIYSNETPDIEPIMDSIRCSWLPKVNVGFFMRAESFFNFSLNLDDMAREFGQDVYESYGGISLNKQSHGEAFLSLFSNRFGRKGIYIFDEPEAALSPERQLTFLGLLHQMSKSGDIQIIMATHSPILMSTPDADLLYLDGEGNISEKPYKSTPHWSLYARFMDNPEKFHHLMLDELEQD